MTLHQLRTHPQPVEGCFGCKLATVNFNGCFPTRSNGAGRGDATAQKKWDAELDKFADLRSQGISPAGTTMDKVEAADRYSQKHGIAFDAHDPYQHIKIED